MSLKWLEEMTGDWDGPAEHRKKSEEEARELFGSDFVLPDEETAMKNFGEAIGDDGKTIMDELEEAAKEDRKEG